MADRSIAEDIKQNANGLKRPDKFSLPYKISVSDKACNDELEERTKPKKVMFRLPSGSELSTGSDLDDHGLDPLTNDFVSLFELLKGSPYKLAKLINKPLYYIYINPKQYDDGVTLAYYIQQSFHNIQHYFPEADKFVTHFFQTLHKDRNRRIVLLNEKLNYAPEGFLGDEYFIRVNPDILSDHRPSGMVPGLERRPLYLLYSMIQTYNQMVNVSRLTNKINKRLPTMPTKTGGELSFHQAVEELAIMGQANLNRPYPYTITSIFPEPGNSLRYSFLNAITLEQFIGHYSDYQSELFEIGYMEPHLSFFVGLKLSRYWNINKRVNKNALALKFQALQAPL